MCEVFEVEDLALMIRATRGRSMNPWIHGSAAGAGGRAAAGAATVCTSHVIIGGDFAPPYIYMIRYIQ